MLISDIQATFCCIAFQNRFNGSGGLDKNSYQDLTHIISKFSISITFFFSECLQIQHSLNLLQTKTHEKLFRCLNGALSQKRIRLFNLFFFGSRALGDGMASSSQTLKKLDRNSVIFP